MFSFLDNIDNIIFVALLVGGNAVQYASQLGLQDSAPVMDYDEYTANNVYCRTSGKQFKVYDYVQHY